MKPYTVSPKVTKKSERQEFRWTMNMLTARWMSYYMAVKLN